MKTDIANIIISQLIKCAIVILIWFLPFSTSAQKVVLVTATEYCQQISQEDAKRIYKGELNRVNNNALIFLDHQVNTQVYKDFLQQYFNVSVSEMQKYWQQAKMQSGKTPPKFLPEPFLPKALKSIKGSISYYYEGQVPDGLIPISY